MALINCPECNKEVSDSAAACPHCGYDISEHLRKMEEQQQRAKYLVEQAAAIMLKDEKRANRKKMSTKKKVAVAVCSALILAAVAVGLFPTWYSLFTGRDTFYTKKAMLEYLEGEWVCNRTTIVQEDRIENLPASYHLKKIRNYEWLECSSYKGCFEQSDENQIIVLFDGITDKIVSLDKIYHYFGYIDTLGQSVRLNTAGMACGILALKDGRLYVFSYGWLSTSDAQNEVCLMIEEYVKIKS